MSPNPTPLPVRLFYSYSHQDLPDRKQMEKILANLRKNDLLRDWSDAQITPGQSISAAIKSQLQQADIIVFLFSPDFLASDSCREEWEIAKQVASSGRPVFRVPIILRVCSWLDFLGDDDVKALPEDGKPITAYPDAGSGWHAVYEGIKEMIQDIRTTYTSKPEFLTDFAGADIFVFPRLTMRDYRSQSINYREILITSAEALFNEGSSIIHGQDKSGKTALAKHIYLRLVDNERPVLFADLGATTSNLDERHIRTLFGEQFSGDYSLWQQQGDTTFIVDNVTEDPAVLDFIEWCSSLFSRVLLFASSDVFYAFFMDEPRLAEYNQVSIEQHLGIPDFWLLQ